MIVGAMTGALVEPALYVFSKWMIADDRDAFRRFWSIFEKLRSLLEGNNARLHCTEDLYGAINRLFPWEHEPDWGGDFYHSAAGQVIRFLDARLAPPIWQYGGSEDAVTFHPSLEQHGVYADEDVALAWSDQLARHAFDGRLCLRSRGELLATCEPWSCVTQAIRSGSDLEVHGPAGAEATLQPICLDRGELPAGWLDPAVLARLRDRRAVSRPEQSPDIDFEQTGHGPSIRVKRMITLLGDDVGHLVVRIASDRHVPGATDLSKLELDSKPDILRYRIGSGEEVLKGIIQTCARDNLEQAVALAYIRPRLIERCRQAGFPVLDE